MVIALLVIANVVALLLLYTTAKYGQLVFSYLQRVLIITASADEEEPMNPDKEKYTVQLTILGSKMAPFVDIFINDLTPVQVKSTLESAFESFSEVLQESKKA